jgi:hypothetical protein
MPKMPPPDHQDVNHRALDRERKRLARERDARMRGRRSVFEIGKAIAKRAKRAKGDKR